MNHHPEDYSVQVTVPFTDAAGLAYVPTVVRAVLVDGYDLVLVDFGDIAFAVGATEVSILVPAQLNRLAPGEVRAVRQLRVSLRQDLNSVSKVHNYVIEAEQSLVVMSNTFQSYEAADLLALETSSVSGWNSSDETRRRAALAEAYRRITSIPMRYGIRDVDGFIDQNELLYIERDMWLQIGVDAYTLFPTHFKRALRMAQFVEANELLQGDQIGLKHRAGIISETIGESSVTLRADRVNYGLSILALSVLTGYINFDMRIARS